MAGEDRVHIVPISASEVEFHEATPAQRAESWRLNGTANGLNRYWMLTRIADPAEVVVSCETTRKTVYCGGLGGYREVRAYAIASVYTNPKYRRNGMAALLLTHLKGWMDGEGASECSALYSDIGKVCFLSLPKSLDANERTVGILYEARLARVSISTDYHCLH
jgi:GNAT superfamily N-acetyltransferase